MISTIIMDIEATDLAADRGVVLCMCYESSDEPGVVHTLRNDEVARKSWKAGRRGDDKEIVKKANALLRSHDVIVAHNGTRYDLPFLRTRAVKWGLEPLKEHKIVDPLSIAWRKFRLQRNSLGSISSLLELSDRKTPLDLAVWADAMLNGSKKAMDLIVEHCVADVKVLSGVLPHVKPFIKALDDRGSAL